MPFWCNSTTSFKERIHPSLSHFFKKNATTLNVHRLNPRLGREEELLPPGENIGSGRGRGLRAPSSEQIKRHTSKFDLWHKGKSDIFLTSLFHKSYANTDFPCPTVKAHFLKKKKKKKSLQFWTRELCVIYILATIVTLKISCTERKMESYALIFENETTIWRG